MKLLLERKRTEAKTSLSWIEDLEIPIAKMAILQLSMQKLLLEAFNLLLMLSMDKQDYI